MLRTVRLLQEAWTAGNTDQISIGGEVCSSCRNPRGYVSVYVPPFQIGGTSIDAALCRNAFVRANGSCDRPKKAYTARVEVLKDAERIADAILGGHCRFSVHSERLAENG